MPTFYTIYLFVNRKIPGGVFGRTGEMHLFAAVDLSDEEQIDEIRR